MPFSLILKVSILFSLLLLTCLINIKAGHIPESSALTEAAGQEKAEAEEVLKSAVKCDKSVGKSKFLRSGAEKKLARKQLKRQLKKPLKEVRKEAKQQKKKLKKIKRRLLWASFFSRIQGAESESFALKLMFLGALILAGGLLAILVSIQAAVMTLSGGILFSFLMALADSGGAGEEWLLIAGFLGIGILGLFFPFITTIVLIILQADGGTQVNGPIDLVILGGVLLFMGIMGGLFS